MENWKAVVGYEGLYEVSDHGRVRSIDHREVRIDGRNRNHRGRIRSQVIVNGYPAVTLSKNNVITGHHVHRLVMKAFVPYGEKEQVNHMDGNKKNNMLANLEWATRFENMAHATDIGIGTGKAVVAVSPSTGEIVHRYPSMNRAERDGFLGCCISLCCMGKSKSHAGLIWRYA